MHHQHKVRPGRDAVALLHGGVGHHARFKGQRLVVALPVQCDLCQSREAAAQGGGQFVGVEQRNLLRYQARVPQALDAPQAGGRRHMATLGQRLVAQRGVLLQLVEQAKIGAV